MVLTGVSMTPATGGLSGAFPIPGILSVTAIIAASIAAALIQYM